MRTTNTFVIMTLPPSNLPIASATPDPSTIDGASMPASKHALEGERHEREER